MRGSWPFFAWLVFCTIVIVAVVVFVPSHTHHEDRFKRQVEYALDWANDCGGHVQLERTPHGGTDIVVVGCAR